MASLCEWSQLARAPARPLAGVLTFFGAIPRCSTWPSRRGAYISANQPACLIVAGRAGPRAAHSSLPVLTSPAPAATEPYGRRKVASRAGGGARRRQRTAGRSAPRTVSKCGAVCVTAQAGGRSPGGRAGVGTVGALAALVTHAHGATAPFPGRAYAPRVPRTPGQPAHCGRTHMAPPRLAWLPVHPRPGCDYRIGPVLLRGRPAGRAGLQGSMRTVSRSKLGD
jgi:hypothetical protein